MPTLRPDTAPGPLPPTGAVDVPETLGYRVKNRVLGPPLDTDQLENERLGIPTGLAVFSSDCISSSAYATEEILRVLVPVVGLAAFSLVVPATGMMLVVLFFLILSYRQTIKEYPTAGGAYMVTRDNFGMVPALVAGVSLLIDYVLTVAVSASAGAAALASAFPAFAPWLLPLALFFIVLVAFGNLKGVRESGKVFSVPTYFFMVMMAVVIAVGLFKMITGGLHPQSIHQKGMIDAGSEGGGLFLGAGLVVFLHAFASGGSAMTGVEAISNGVTAFRKVEWKNARRALVLMGMTLGTAFLGLSVLSTRVHAVPYEDGTPTVISQIGKQVFGESMLGHTGFFMLQAATMLILVMATNTSFADFPRLASFAADDNFLPRQLRRRGHRLVFSNGILALAAVAAVLVVVTGASVARLIPLYAIGVFTSFTLSQAGMAKHHITRREPGWRWGLAVNGVGAVLSAVVDVIFAAAKFREGAWIVIVLIPVFVVVLVRLNRQYARDDALLERDAEAAVADPILRRHVVL
ncbi:MAG: APC family permease, partial [Acidimicrobiia bacterium]|nr:APC family permease [Acidimicrobiia bacterium]